MAFPVRALVLRAGLVALLAVTLSAVLPYDVLAHAAFVRAEPGPDIAMPTSPTRVSIWFTEPLAPALSAIEVLDGLGEKADRGDSAVDSSDPTRMSVTVAGLRPGTYTVAWRNVSTVDGHPLRGSYVFYVGERPEGVTAGGSQPPPLLPSPLDPWARWAVLLTASCATGALLFRWTVLSPALAALPPRAAERTVGGVLPRLLGRVAIVAVALFLFASLLHLLVQASGVADEPLWRVSSGDVRDVLQHTTWGRYWALRFGLAIVAMALLLVAHAGVAQPESLARQFARGSALLLLLVGLGTFSRSSHAAAVPGLGVTAIGADYVHLLAAALWVGGLFALLPVLVVVVRSLSGSERRIMLATLAGQFTIAGALGLGALVLTGLFASWLQVGSFAALASAYGVTLIAKLSLVGVLAALGAVNLLWVRPRIARADSEARAGRWLPRVVAGEVAVAMLILLATGFLTSLEPARQTSARAEGPGIAFDQTDGGTRIHGRVEPGLPGNNRVRIEILDRRGERVVNASSVTAHVKYLDVELGETVTTATPGPDGRYEAGNIALSIAGTWQLQIRVTRPDAADATAATRFGIGGSADATASGGASPDVARVLWAWMVVGLGGVAR
jgi:copper transport protein